MAISPIFNCHKIKFSKLDELNPLNGKKVRFFINLESVLKRILTQYVNNYLVARNDTLYTKKELLSNIINLAQHYRLYCAKQDIESEVYLYWNYPCGNFNNYKYNSTMVQANETGRLDLVSYRVYGTPVHWWIIARFNSIIDPDSVQAGTRLRIPILDLQ